MTALTVRFHGGPLDGITAPFLGGTHVMQPVCDDDVPLRAVMVGVDDYGPVYEVRHLDFTTDAAPTAPVFGQAIYDWRHPGENWPELDADWTGTSWHCSDENCDRCPIRQEPT